MYCRVCGTALAYAPGSGNICRKGDCRRIENERIHRLILERKAERAAWSVTPRTHITSTKRRKLHEANGWVCYLCGGPTDPNAPKGHPDSAVVEHKTPLSRGGTTDPDNLDTAHWRCNRDKGQQTAEEFASTNN